MEKEFLVYINGEYFPKSQAKVTVFDHGLLYGDGVFEGIRAYSGVVFKLREHIDRLYQSAHAIMLEIPMSKDEMIQAILETLKRNNLREAYIRPVVTRGPGDLGLDPRNCQDPTIIIITETLTLHNVEVKEKGARTIITWVRRDSIDATSHEIKSLNYLNSILARIEANNAEVDEAICLDKYGFVCEGSVENLFIMSDGTIFTPPTFIGVLPGITRKRIIKLLKELGYEVIERNISTTELFAADEVFFTGTAAEIVPVVEISKRKIGNGLPGPITKQIMQEFEIIKRDPKEGIPIEFQS
ncbi:MAG: branched-chain-amino-acid transaminase [Candidatus Heimdallarchaeota archaeon]